MKGKIGFLTIGQSPRDDVVGEIQSELGHSWGIIEAGALDSLSSPKIKSLRPGPDEFPLITRLRNGRPAIVGRKKIVPFLHRRVRALERRGVDILALLCTEEFPELHSHRPLLQPAYLLRPLVLGALGRGSLFVLVPLPEQKKQAEEKWHREGLTLTVDTLPPYGEKVHLSEVVSGIRASSPGLVVLDCLGYSRAIKEKIHRATGKPILLPRQALAAWIRMLI